MMGRARRLKEIADANQPAFDLTKGTLWWLEETPNNPRRTQPRQPQKPVLTSQQEVITPSLPAVQPLPAVQETVAMAEAATASVQTGSGDALSEFWRKDEPESAKPEPKEKKMTWDEKACCFVPTA